MAETIKTFSKDKHAFCIMAHDKWSQLQRLVDCIDDVRNDIYIHIDKRSYVEFLNWGGVKTRFSELYVIDNPIVVSWSHISLSDGEVLLYKTVLKSGKKYNYIHLFSGADLPLVTTDFIHYFFQW